MHSLVDFWVCSRVRHGIYTLALWGQCSNQLSRPARASKVIFTPEIFLAKLGALTHIQILYVSK